MIDKLRPLWRSVGSRLAFYYGCLVVITIMAALAIIYLQTVGVMHQRMARQVSLTAQQLLANINEGGFDAASAAIARALADDHDAENEIYLLIDGEGRRLAGNLDRLPEATGGTGPVQRRVERGGRSVNAYLVSRTLPGGGVLVVGQNLRDQEMIESLVARASGAAGIFAVLLLIGGTFVFRQELERHVGSIRLTARRIATAGRLQERVAESGEDDEFALLNREINAMLDRIESLMEGVRHVSDTIAHNLRTPLTRILVNLREAERVAGSVPGRAAVAAAIREVEELTLVFEKLLQIAEAEAGARRRSFTQVSLNVIANDVLELYEAVAETQGAVLVREPADEALLSGDRDLLAGAIANLLDNALKYAGPGAVIRVGTLETPDGFRLTVRDNGPGVPARQMERLGMRFHRLNPEAPGHGLGLASVQAVAALHGGQLRFEDADPGLCAVIDLPRSPA